MEPPAYEVAVKLPTYEEAQQEKMASEERGRADQHHAHHHHHHLHRHGGRTEPAGLGKRNLTPTAFALWFDRRVVQVHRPNQTLWVVLCLRSFQVNGVKEEIDRN